MWQKYISNYIDNFHKINENNFESIALDVFYFQYEYNSVYRQYVDFLKINAKQVNSIYEIPFLPISFFKTHDIKTGDWKEKLIFESSGTTGQIRSKNYVYNPEFYLEISKKYFEEIYESLDNYIVLALLPSYLEKGNSSLVYMAKHFIECSKNDNSGFFLYEYDKLNSIIKENSNKNILLLGVSYALLDYAEKFNAPSTNLLIMETGGMKGKRQELTKQELHSELKSKFSVNAIHSEYGMTELFSQGYSKADGILQFPNWVKILLREQEDPFSENVTKGVLKIIDLANIYSCCFIETQDIFSKIESNKYEIIGRLDNSDIRGCNLLVID